MQFKDITPTLFAAFRLCRYVYTLLGSPLYSPMYGPNPVLLLDWRKYKRAAKRLIWRGLAAFFALYVIAPVWLGYMLAIASMESTINRAGQEFRLAVLFTIIALVCIFLLLHLFAFTILNLINPLGKYYGEPVVSDLACIPGGYRMFLAARLFPRVSIVLAMFVVVLIFIEAGFKAMDVIIITLPEYYLIMLFSAVLSTLHFLGLGLLIQMCVRTLWVRAILILLLVFVSASTFKPEWLLAAIDLIVEWDIGIPGIHYLALWGLHPFGSSEAISRFFTDAMSPMAKYFQPWTAFWIRSGVQFVVVLLIWTIAFRKFHIRWSNTASYPSRSFHL